MSFPPIYLLQTLAAFHETGTVAKAAARLSATQPTVTRQLQQLEAWSRTPLFESQGRKKFLTTHGRELAEAFEKRFGDFSLDILHSQRRHARPVERELRICGDGAVLGEFFAALDFPGHLALIAMGYDEVLRVLQKQETDVAVLPTHVEAAEYVTRRLFTTRPQLLMPKRWAREVPSFRDLKKLCAKHPFCAHTAAAKSVLEAETLQETLDLSEVPHPRSVSSDWQVIEARVHQQQAWALAPSNFSREGRGYWRVELPDTFERVPYFIYMHRSIAKSSWLKETLAGIGS